MCECVRIEYYACNLLVVRKNWFVEWRQNQESSLPTNWTAYKYFFFFCVNDWHFPAMQWNEYEAKERKKNKKTYCMMKKYWSRFDTVWRSAHCIGTSNSVEAVRPNWKPGDVRGNDEEKFLFFNRVCRFVDFVGRRYRLLQFRSV